MGSAIFQMPARTPAMTAMTAATIDNISGGRMLLGIGSSGPQVAEGWHGQPFAKQLQRTREYVAIVRKALARERLEFDGEMYTLPLPDGPGKALKLTIAPGAGADPDLHRGDRPEEHPAHRRDRRRLAAHLLLPRARRASSAALLEEGAARAGNGKAIDESFDIAPNVNVSIDDDVDRARDSMRPVLALYVGGMGSREKNFYNALVRRYGFEDAADEVQDLYLDGKKDEAAAALPAELIDRVALCGPKERVAERLAVYRDAGVGTLVCAPMAFDVEERKRDDPRPGGDAPERGCARAAAAGGSCSPPSAIPGTRSRRSRSGGRSRPAGTRCACRPGTGGSEDVEREGMAFAAAPEYEVWPGNRGLTPYQAAVRAAHETVPVIRAARPATWWSPTSSPWRAGWRPRWRSGRGPRWCPTCCRPSERGLPPYSVGARLPRTRRRAAALGSGAAAARARRGAGARGAERRAGAGGAGARSATRTAGSRGSWRWWRPSPSSSTRAASRRRGCGSPGRCCGSGRSRRSSRRRATTPLVLVAPSTSQDPRQEMLRAALEGLAGEPVRVLATTNRRPPERPLDVPANARVVDWLSYARTMPRCAAVVCHAGHGTVARALASGVPVVGCPAAGDMAENAARVAWAGCGVSLPRRLVTPRGIRLAVRKLLAEPGYAERARRAGRLGARHDGGEVAARAVEGLAAARSA